MCMLSSVIPNGCHHPFCPPPCLLFCNSCIFARADAQARNSRSHSMACDSGTSTAGAMPPPDNNIDEDRPHTWMASGGGTSIPSISAPHRSLDSVPTAGEQSLQDGSESTDMWQAGTGRGIRAHDTITGIYIYIHFYIDSSWIFL